MDFYYCRVPLILKAVCDLKRLEAWKRNRGYEGRKKNLVCSKIRLLLALFPPPTPRHTTPPPSPSSPTPPAKIHGPDIDSEQPAATIPSLSHHRASPEVTRPASKGC
jgi:hypothetical protein